MLADPIDAGQFTSVPYSSRSFWQQPWRSYLDTWPAARFRKGVGINFNVSPNQAEATAAALQRAGVTEARMEIPWNQISFSDPSRFGKQFEDGNRAKLLALRRHHIRPLILLNSNDSAPTPTDTVHVNLSAPAEKGATTIALDPFQAEPVIPGRSGFDFNRVAAGVLITSVSPLGFAQLSRPLPQRLDAGSQAVTVLSNEPFAPPFLDSGGPNPRFETTLRGWLDYVHTTTDLVRSVLGNDHFDVEVWNELSFGSRFLFNSAYYDNLPDAANGSAKDEMLKRTIAFLKDPANGVSNVRIGDGFTSQSQLLGGGEVPAGLSAIDKHPYYGGVRYPAGQPFTGQRPIDALGKANYRVLPSGNYRDGFVPSFRDFMPEHWLTAIKTESLIRDLSPRLNAGFKGVLHGRGAAPAGGPAPQMWLTEYNIDTGEADKWTHPHLTDAERLHMLAKAALRTYSAWLAKGATQVDMFAATGIKTLSLIPDSFFAAVKAGRAHPDPGPVLHAVGRLTAAMRGPKHVGRPRRLHIERIADTHDHFQFRGNGTRAYPPLYDRDVLAVFPFQAARHRFVVPVYVMTRDISHVYPRNRRGAGGRFDMRPERFSITITGLDGKHASAGYLDPMTGARPRVRISQRTADSVTVSLDATDSPRVLTLTDG